MEEVLAIIKKDGTKSKPWCLHFSNHKECFTSKKLAQKREQQVNFFKNRGTTGIEESPEEFFAMASLGIHSEYINEEEEEIVYIVSEDDGSFSSFLVKDESDEIQVIKLDKNYESIESYQEILDQSNSAENEDVEVTLKLSEAVIGEQIIKGSHKHSAKLKNGAGYSSTDFGHKHFVDMYGGEYYVGYAPVEISGIMLKHRHLVEVKPNS